MGKGMWGEEGLGHQQSGDERQMRFGAVVGYEGGWDQKGL